MTTPRNAWLSRFPTPRHPRKRHHHHRHHRELSDLIGAALVGVFVYCVWVYEAFAWLLVWYVYGIILGCAWAVRQSVRAVQHLRALRK